MIGWGGRRAAHCALVGLALMVLADRATAQLVDTTFGFFSTGARPLLLHLDSLGVYAPGVGTVESIQTLVAPWGGHSPRRVGRGLFVVAVPQALTREGLSGRAREAVAQGGGVIRHAGIGVRAPGGRIEEILFVTDHFIVEFQPGVPRASIDSLNSVYRVRVVSRLGLLENDYLLAVTPESPGDALHVANLYHQSPLTIFAHPDYLDAGVEHAVFPNDPLFGDQWHLHNTGATHGAPDADIDAPEAWDVEKGSASVVIAVVETRGFDTLNLDLHANLWTNPAETPSNGVDEAADPWKKVDDIRGWNFDGCFEPQATDWPTDPCGRPGFDEKTGQQHGTAVAGLAAARGGNAIGVSGVCPECSLMLITLPVKDAGTAAAIRYAWEQGADVLNLSWTCGLACRTYTTTQIADALTLGRGGKGTIVVASASENNDDKCADYLHGMSEVIAVAGSDDFDRRATLSGFGACIDIMAPGWMANTLPKVPATPPTLCIPPRGDGSACHHVAGIVTTDSTGSGGYNSASLSKIGCKLTEVTTPVAELDYTRCFSGTSAAAPIVAGVVGLMLSKNPNLTAAEVKEILYRTADRIEYDANLCPANPAGYTPACPIDVTSWSPTHGHGRVNAFAAVEAASVAGGSTAACTVTPCDADVGAFEIGARMGATILSGGTDRTTLALPGSGPLAVPALYAAWFPTGSLQLELHLGASWHSGGPAPDERDFAAALHPGILFSTGSGSVFLSGSLALRTTKVGAAPSTTETGAGAAIGYRFKPKPFLAIRFEGLYRRWFAANIDEIGLTLGFGVVLP